MKEKGNITKNFLIIVGVFIVVGVGGYLYTNRNVVPDDNLLIGVPVGGSATVDGDLLTALRDLQRLRFDTSIFSDPVFMSLQNFSKILTQQPAERQNPFAPINPSEVSVEPINVIEVSTSTDPL